MTKKHSTDLYWSVLTMLCLLECMFPWTFNYANVRARWSGDDKSNEKMLDFRKSAEKIGRRNDKLWNLAVDLCESDWLSYTRRLRVIQAYIFTEYQPLAPQPQQNIRTLNGSDLTHAPSGLRNEPSLEDIDLIDFLWRQDIDAEKGMYASIQPPEDQFETDLQMLSEKSFTTQQPRMLNVGSNNGSLQQYEDYLKSLENDLYASQKAFDGFDPYSWSDSNMYSPEWDEKQQFVQLQKTLDTVADQQEQQQQLASTNFDNRLSINQSSLANGTTFEGPTNDLLLGSATLNTSDYSGLLSIFDEPDTSSDLMDWNVPFYNPASEAPSNFDNFAQTDYNGLPQLSFSNAINDVDSIQTPNLDMSPNDVTRLFSDRQVAQDLTDAYNRKTKLSSVGSVGSSFSPVSDSMLSRSTPSSVGQQLNEFDYNDGDILAEFFMPTDPSRVSLEKFTPLPSTELPDYDRPSTSYAGASSNDSYGRYCDNGDDGSKSVVDHDHHYCTSPNADSGIFEVEIGTTSADSYAEQKIMPTMIFPSIKNPPLDAALLKKLADDEEYNSDFDENVDGADEASSGSGTPLEYLHASARDEDLAFRHRLPYSASEIINMPAARFSLLLKDPSLGAEQADLIRRIRRRGRNKVAAQNCRQRRIDDENQLRSEIGVLEQERSVYASRRQQIMKMAEAERKRLRDLMYRSNHKRS